MAVSDAGLRELLFPESLRIKKEKYRGAAIMKKWEKRLLFMFSGIFFLGIAIAGCEQKHPDQMQEHYTIDSFHY